MNQDFEKGREIQKLEDQIYTLYSQIYLGIGKDNPAQQTSLRTIVEDAFQQYVTIAVQYEIHPHEVERVREIYYKALGKEYLLKYTRPEGFEF